MAKILDGKGLSIKLGDKLAKKVRALSVRPKLVIIQIGDLAESNTYIKNKKIFGEKIGVAVEHKKYPENISESKIISDIRKLNGDESVHGIIVQLPGPENFDIEKVLEAIDPQKDVDGLTAINTKHLFDRKEAFIPATARGVISMLEDSGINLSGKKVVIVGESSLVGRPTTLALLNRGVTVTVCHSKTRGLAEETKRGDILITAVGKPKLITSKHVSKNQVVVDIGITITKTGKVVGDVDFEKVEKIVKAITPVPGGVGPMTVVSLFQNLLETKDLK